MAFFEKLKEKVIKTIDSVKKEVAKGIDPSIKEQELLAKEKALQEQKEQEKQEKEKLINDFFDSINMDEEFEYIFNILEKSSATAINFEKGVKHMLSKAEMSVPEEEIIFVIKKELFSRAFSDAECVVAKAVATDYFVHAVIDDGLLSKYMRFALAREKGLSMADWNEPFIKALYGVAGRVANYLNNGAEEGNYRTLAAADFESIIANSDVLKSYTDSDPFAADEVRAKWAEDLCNSPLEIVKSSKLASFLDKEESIEALFYFACIKLCGNKDVAVGADISTISNVYLEYLKDRYNRIH